MVQEVNLAGSFTLPGSSPSVIRMGYGAMQLAGRELNKLVWGPPRDPRNIFSQSSSRESQGGDPADSR